MHKKDFQRQRSNCACVGAYIFYTHPKCRKHSSGLVNTLHRMSRDFSAAIYVLSGLKNSR
jgi:hypothetical protein